jgi:hypothetical protein
MKKSPRLSNVTTLSPEISPKPGAYHNGIPLRQRETKRKRSQRRRNWEDRPMIAWDGEGIKLSGDDQPQHYVLFGCSAESDTPLRIYSPKGSLGFVELADYMCAVSSRHPQAFHIGYFFEYDQNMIIKDLPWRIKHRIHENGSAIYTYGEIRYRIAIVPGKKIRISRTTKDGEKTSILIEDIGSYFATSFIKAYQTMFPGPTDSTFEKVIEGKAKRASTSWLDMKEIVEYWTHEVIAVQRLAEKFKSIMGNAGFPLTQWYGPGSLAAFIRREHKLIEHEWGGKEENIPTEVHHAVKGAYYGGHFEQYMVGRIPGPIWGYDLNSAYPAAFCTVPTMREGGIWVRVAPERIRERCLNAKPHMGIYRVRWANTHGSILERRPQPLPHRDDKGTITYPAITDGWYFSPEIQALILCKQSEDYELIEGWEWLPADDTCYPWSDVLRPMYQKRLALKAGHDPTQMAFKLGPNSLYGKMAQRAGWDKDKNRPPRSHTLCIAGYVTSYCRAQIMLLMRANGPGVIAVETDGMFTTKSPEEINEVYKGRMHLTKELGDWTATKYDEMIFVQNGLYMARQGDKWTTLKTRGIERGVFLDANGEISEELLAGYLSSCYAGEQWKPMQLPAGERFVGIGGAIARSRKDRTGPVNPFKASRLHCRWFTDSREIDPGGKGKRIHIAKNCPACQRGLTANDGPHPLTIRSRSFMNPISVPYVLPWEKEYKELEWQALDAEYAGLLPAGRS